MKKIHFFIFLILPLIQSCVKSDMKSESFITAQDFIKEKLNYPVEAEFNSDYVFEKEGETFIVIGHLTAKNAFGVRSELYYKIWLTFNGEDWMETSNWNCEKLIIEDPVTGKQQKY